MEKVALQVEAGVTSLDEVASDRAEFLEVTPNEKEEIITLAKETGRVQSSGKDIDPCCVVPSARAG